MRRAISQFGGVLLHALIGSRPARLVLAGLLVALTCLGGLAAPVKAQTSLTASFGGANLQTYWLPNAASWTPALSGIMGGSPFYYAASATDSGYAIAGSGGGDLSLGFDSPVTITAIGVDYDQIMTASDCNFGHNDGYSYTAALTANGGSVATLTGYDGHEGCFGSYSPFPTPYSMGADQGTLGGTVSITGSGVTLHFVNGLKSVIKSITIVYTGCETQCYNSSGYVIGGGGGAASPNSCTFGDGYLVTGQGPLFYICIAQQFILRQIEPPLASIFQELSAVTHIAYSTGVWLSAAGQGAVNWIASGVTQFAQYLNSVVSAAANGIINAILQLVIVTQGAGGGGSGTCGGGQGGIFGFLLQLIGCDIIGKITDLLTALIGGIVSLATTLINAILSFLQAVIGLILAIAGMILGFAEYLISTMLSLFTALLGALSAANAASQTTGIITTALSPTCTDPTIASPVCTLLALLDNTIFANPLIPDLFNAMIGATVLGMLFWAAQRLSGVLEAAA